MTNKHGTLLDSDIEWAIESALRNVENDFVRRVARDAEDIGTATQAVREALQGECHSWLSDGVTRASWAGLYQSDGLEVTVANRAGIVTWREVALAARTGARQRGLL